MPLIFLPAFVAFLLKPMTLRKKTLLLVAVTILCLITVLHITSTRVLLKGFKDVEAQNARENVQRVVESYSDELIKLNLMNGDWAEWDATYNFMQNYNNAYIEENLNDATLIRGKINLVAYVSKQHQLVYGKLVEPNQAQSSTIPEQLKQFLTDSHFSPQHDSQRAGIVLTPEGAIMITARNIFNSEGRGLSCGILFMGRYLDIEQLAKQTHFSLALQRDKVELMPPDFKEASQALANRSSPFLKLLNKDIIAGYTLLKDIDSKPVLLLRVDTPRAIYKQGQISTRYISLFLCVVGLIFGLLTLLLLEYLVLSRLTRLTTGVSRIANGGNLLARVRVSGKDEISYLANNINMMLQQLASSQKILQESEERYRVFFAQSSEGIWRCELEQPVAINCSDTEQIEYFYKHCYLGECNNVLACMLGYRDAQELIGININELLITSLPSSKSTLIAFIQQKYRIIDREIYQVDRQGNKK